VVLLEPKKGVLDKEAANGAAFRPIEINGSPPRRPISVAKIRAELAEVVSFRSKMVVYNIESHSELMGVCGVNESLKREWTSVTILDSKRVDAVVAPIARSGKLRYGHQFDRGYSKISQIR